MTLPVVLPFVFPAASAAVTPRTVQQAARWAAKMGEGWGVESWSDEGGLVVGLVTPSSEVDPIFPDETPSMAWLISDDVGGVLLLDAEIYEPAGIFPTVQHALAAVEQAERERWTGTRNIPANDA